MGDGKPGSTLYKPYSYIYFKLRYLLLCLFFPWNGLYIPLCTTPMKVPWETHIQWDTEDFWLEKQSRAPKMKQITLKIETQYHLTMNKSQFLPQLNNK